MELGRLMAADARPGKIDLGVGTYRDEHGAIPIMRVVKTAERTLLETQESKGYLGPAGDAEFARLVQEAFLPGLEAQKDGRIARVQTPGGTGALRLALQLIALANPGARVWIATPTWPAHIPLVLASGLRVETYPHLGPDGALDGAQLEAALSKASRGDVLLLHGCCHNPTGVDLTAEDWTAVARSAAEKGLLPLIDLAYPGMGEGLEADLAGVKQVLAACPSALVALSCSKTFGLYRDRAGLLLGLAPDARSADNLKSVAASQARLLWSNPPDHGAAVVRLILGSPQSTEAWKAELGEMRRRINDVRAELAGLDLKGLDLRPLRRQRGMFALLPLSPDEVVRLRSEHGIYVDASGRMNVAGLNPSNFAAFAQALAMLHA